MSDRSSRPRAVPAAIDAHRVVPAPPRAPTPAPGVAAGGAAVVRPAAPAVPAVHAPVGRRSVVAPAAHGQAGRPSVVAPAVQAQAGRPSVAAPVVQAQAGRPSVAAPTVQAQAGRPSSEAARVARTVDALRRLQVTLAAAQTTLDGVLREIAGAVDGPGRERSRATVPEQAPRPSVSGRARGSR